MGAPECRTTVEPLNDHIVVQPKEPRDMSEGGIILPDAAKEKQARGIVIAVGPGRRDKDGKRLPIDVKVGELIAYGKYAGADMKIGFADYIVMGETDVLAIIHEPEEKLAKKEQKKKKRA